MTRIPAPAELGSRSTGSPGPAAARHRSDVRPGAATRQEIMAAPAFGGIEPADLATRFGTPLFIYDLDVVTNRVNALREALPGAVELAFAVKANPSLAVLAHLGSLGLGADIASAGELEAVRRAGIDPARVVFTGPAKTDAELAAALDARVGALTIESLQELDRLITLVGRPGRVAPQPVLLRVATASRGEGQPIIDDGGLGKFGLTLAELERAAERATASGAVRVIGLHSFGASNVRSADILIEHAQTVVELGAGLAERHRLAIGLIDVGGGLGIPYRDGESALDLGSFGAGLAAIVERMEASPLLRAARLLVEPGRYLVGPAGAYVSRVVGTKERGGRRLALVDGGIHHLIRPALIGTTQRTILLGEGDRGEPVQAVVAGPLCTGLDILAAAVELPAPVPGDLIAILDAGSYGFTESMPYFLSHPQPAEVVLRGGVPHLARPRLDPREVLDRQVLPPW